MQDETLLTQDCDVDFAVKNLGDPLKPSHALCPTCNQVKPIKEFKAKSTFTQAIAWGYKKAIEIVHSKCKHCRTPPKRTKDMTIKEIRNRISSGDIRSPLVGNALIKEKQEEIIRKKREAIEKRWRSARAVQWQALLTASTPEYTRIRKQVSLCKLDKPQLQSFFSVYRDAIVNVRAMLSLEKRGGRHTPEKNKPWHGYIPSHVREELRTLWDSVPFIQRHTLKQPEVFNSKLTKGEPQ